MLTLTVFFCPHDASVGQKFSLRIRLAIRELLRRGRASGQQVDRLIGHLTFVSLCRRAALPPHGEVYTFIKRHYTSVVPLWKSVRRELMIWDGLCPLAFQDLTIPWSNNIYAVDASEWGLDVCVSPWFPQRGGGFGMKKLENPECLHLWKMTNYWLEIAYNTISTMFLTKRHVFIWWTGSGMWSADTNGFEKTPCQLMRLEVHYRQWGITSGK